MDVAEHMFTKYKGHAQSFTASTAESVADLFYEMGKGLLTKYNYETAVRWLGRASDTLGGQSVDTLSAEAGELRLSILLSLGVYNPMQAELAAHKTYSSSAYESQRSRSARQSMGYNRSLRNS